MSTTKKSTVGEVETRSAPTTVKAPATGRTLTGLVPFGVVADLGDRTEELAPGCFDGCDMSELIACVEHTDTRLLARHPGTLKVEVAEDGLHWTATLPDTREAAETRALVRRGDLAACSWRMVVADESWCGSHRVVRRIARLLDVSPVARPAYGTAAGIELRSRTRAVVNEEGGGRMADEQAAETADNTNNNSTDGGTYDVGGTLTLTPPDDGGEQVEQRSAPARGGGLRVADVDRRDEGGSIERRIVEAARSVERGESRSLTATNAGAILPEQLDGFVWDALRPASAVLASGVKVISPQTATVRMPIITGDADASWTAQATGITPSQPTLGELVAEPKALKTLVYGASEIFDDSNPDLLELLRGHLLNLHAAELDDALINGDGTGNGIVGLIETDDIRTFDADGLPLFEALTRAAGALRAAGGGEAVALAHPYSVVHADLTRDDAGATAGTGSWLPRPASAPKVVEAARLPLDTDANTASALVYLPQRLVVVRRQQTQIDVDRSAEFSSDQVGVRARSRATIAVPDPKSVVLVKNVEAPDPLAAESA